MTPRRITTSWGDVIEVYLSAKGDLALSISCSTEEGVSYTTTPLPRDQALALAEVIVDLLNPTRRLLSTVWIQAGDLPEVSDGDWGDVLKIRPLEGEITDVHAIRGADRRLLAVSVTKRVYRWDVGGYMSIQSHFAPTDLIEVIEDEAVKGMDFA